MLRGITTCLPLKRIGVQKLTAKTLTSWTRSKPSPERETPEDRETCPGTYKLLFKPHVGLA